MFGQKLGIFILVAMLAILKTASAQDVPVVKAQDPSDAKVVKGKPLKIYILAGQSNMQGQSFVGTVPRMAMSPESKALHDKILDEHGKPRVHENVSIAAFSQDGGYGVTPTDQEKHGPLTVGYGNNLKSDRMLGPELGFGITMSELVNEPILLIKTAWGGKSLNENFRPPSAGLPPLPQTEIEKLKASGKYEETMAARKEKYGKYYRLMLKHVQTVLADPGKYCPAYDPKHGYEIAGFAWFQGYNDRFAGPPYDFYSELLCDFIRDVRKELNAPKMIFAIGVIGINGNSEKNPNELALRKAMAAPAEMPEFKGNVVAINTADYWDDEMIAAIKKLREANSMWDSSAYWTAVGTPAPEERIWHYTSFHLDPKEQYRELKEGEKGDERTLVGTVPDDMKGWLEPGFDVGKWQKGPAPIGKGEAKRKKGEPIEKPYRSLWGDGNMLLMKTSFELTRTDFVKYRLGIKSTGSYFVYLNGHIIQDYPWWQNDGVRTFGLTDEQAQNLKQGTNVLAFYGNIMDRKGQVFNAVDLTLEGITQEQLDDITKKQREVCTPRDVDLSKGQSNQSYHYMGSAKTYSLIGEALARAIAERKKMEK